MISAALADEIEEKMRPVGQVVKTEASHAFNIGSNPVRVTKKKRTHYVCPFLFGASTFCFAKSGRLRADD